MIVNMDISHRKQPIVLQEWQHMLIGIGREGYSSAKIAKACGFSKKRLKKWLIEDNTDKIQPRIFTKILYFYCHLQYKNNSK